MSENTPKKLPIFMDIGNLFICDEIEGHQILTGSINGKQAVGIMSDGWGKDPQPMWRLLILNRSRDHEGAVALAKKLLETKGEQQYRQNGKQNQNDKDNAPLLGVTVPENGKNRPTLKLNMGK